jgi:hypothetical protein
LGASRNPALECGEFLFEAGKCHRPSALPELDVELVPCCVRLFRREQSGLRGFVNSLPRSEDPLRGQTPGRTVELGCCLVHSRAKLGRNGFWKADLWSLRRCLGRCRLRYRRRLGRCGLRFCWRGRAFRCLLGRRFLHLLCDLRQAFEGSRFGFLAGPCCYAPASERAAQRLESSGQSCLQHGARHAAERESRA